MIALLLAALPSPAQACATGPPPVHDPAVSASPSGEYGLHVDPTRRDAYGPAACTFTRGEHQARSGERPFILLHAAVTDDGYVAGYANTGSAGDEGEFVAAVLDPSGETVLEHRTARVYGGGLYGRPSPDPLGLFLDREGGWFAVRIADEDVNRGIESGWRFDVRTRRRLLPSARSEPGLCYECLPGPDDSLVVSCLDRGLWVIDDVLSLGNSPAVFHRTRFQALGIVRDPNEASGKRFFVADGGAGVTHVEVEPTT